MTSVTIHIIEYFAEAFGKKVFKDGWLPDFSPGAANRIVEETRRPLATTPEKLMHHLAVTTIYYWANILPFASSGLTLKEQNSLIALGKRAAVLAGAGKPRDRMKELPENLDDTRMHVLFAAARESEAYVEDLKVQIGTLDTKIEDPNSDDKIIEEMAAKKVELMNIMRGIPAEGTCVSIFERIARMRSDLNYIHHLVEAYKERNANWKPQAKPPPEVRSPKDVMNQAEVAKLFQELEREYEQDYVVDPWDSVLGQKGDRGLMMRKKIIGQWLPDICDYHFAPYKFAIGGYSASKGTKDGPGLRFLVACTREIGITHPDGEAIPPSTLADYCYEARIRKTPTLP